MWNHTGRRVASSISVFPRTPIDLIKGFGGFRHCIGAPERENDSKEKCMKLLIVEDNDGMRRVLRRILVDTASTIWECADGSEALAAYEEHRPDIVLMDLRMSDVDGLTATRQIRGYDPSARIIVVTDYQDEDMKTAALEAGACEYVLKHELSGLPEIVSSLAAADNGNH
jgi:CheY-like chemotaxis protein